MKKFFITMIGALALTACTNSSSNNSATATAEKDAPEEVAATEDATAVASFSYDRGAGVIEYDSKKYGETIRPDAELPVVIDFNAVWCGPCQRFKPVFEKVASEYDGAVFISVDVDNNPLAAEQFGVTSIPQVTVLMPDGTTQTAVGAMTEPEFRKMLGI